MRTADIALIGRHATNVVGMILDQVGVQGRERPPHFKRVFLVDAEDDGLGEAVGLRHEAREVFRDGLRSCTKRHDPLEVARGIFGIRDFPTVTV